MALIPTRKIPQLTAYGVPLAGPEMLEIWATGVSRRITARDFALPIDALLTAVNSSSTLPGSRYLTQGIGIVLTDGGPGQPLRIDASGAVAGPANPTAQVGLAAVNGALVTYMRSDAAPALSQAIAPTWTAQHIFALDGVTNAAVMLASNRPQLDWNELDAAANNRRWRQEVASESFLAEVVNDANNAVTIWLQVDRTLNVVDSIALTSTALTWNGNPISTAVGANPTGTVGLAVVNGAALTFMRSDAAPPLSQAIVPTWTAQHIFSLSGATNAAILLSSVQPQIDWNETDGAANNRRWREEANGEQMLFRVVNDANSAAVTWMAIDRTLNVVDIIALTSTALTWNGNPISTAVGANPTGTVGLAAVNGAAATFLRSDGAPPLSQAIVPTWTGIHTWSLVAPILTLFATGAALNAKSTIIRNPNGGLAISSALDASPNTAVDNVFLAGRTAVAWTSLAFGNAADNPTYTFLGTGSFSINTTNLFQVGTSDFRIFRSNSAPFLGFYNAANTTRLGYLQMDSPNTAFILDNEVAAGTIRLHSLSGEIEIRGNGVGAANVGFLAFRDSAGTRIGYIGDGSSGTAALILNVDTAAANIQLSPGAGGTVDFLNVSTITTVGAAGGASALPATPIGYWPIRISGTLVKVPYYTN